MTQLACCLVFVASFSLFAHSHLIRIRISTSLSASASACIIVSNPIVPAVRNNSLLFASEEARWSENEFSHAIRLDSCSITRGGNCKANVYLTQTVGHNKTIFALQIKGYRKGYRKKSGETEINGGENDDLMNGHKRGMKIRNEMANRKRLRKGTLQLTTEEFPATPINGRGCGE
jgi:hypothetical protein